MTLTKDDIKKIATGLKISDRGLENIMIDVIETSKVADELVQLRLKNPHSTDYMILYRDLLKDLIYLERTLRGNGK